MSDEQDWSDPVHVEGAVWAQIEDLGHSAKVRVLRNVLNELTSSERVRRARDTMDFYRDRWDEASSDDEVISDLLSDLMHYAADEDVNFYARLTIAYDNFSEEHHED